ncbi:MAG: FhaA domain-containing protein [Actinomycetota bacterium]
MGILKDFEARLERGIEGFFTKAFRSGLQPIEIAKRILRTMEAQKTVGVKEVWVPNRYVLFVSAEDRQRFANMENALVSELETVVVEGAREHGYGLVARPQVVFETDEALKRGDLRIQPELSEAPGPPPPSQEATPAPRPPSPAAGPARLVQVDGDGREFRLDQDSAVIGRLAGSEIEIQDTGASRRHAEIRRQGSDFVIVDLGSTNGTLVNEAPVAEQVLQEGDRITIGRTVLEFRRG